ncbi:MAG: hypothetical protein JXA90_10805, partial [Planctomycetes bacterium]|nr:hypothetical protein [Planctomycetota bacterium]
LDLSDAVRTLSHLFMGYPEPVCLRTSDVDDDGLVNLTDAVHFLMFLFLGGAAPPAPIARCGPDPTPDPLTCLSFPPCP